MVLLLVELRLQHVGRIDGDALRTEERIEVLVVERVLLVEREMGQVEILQRKVVDERWMANKFVDGIGRQLVDGRRRRGGKVLRRGDVLLLLVAQMLGQFGGLVLEIVSLVARLVGERLIAEVTVRMRLLFQLAKRTNACRTERGRRRKVRRRGGRRRLGGRRGRNGGR